MGHLKFRTLGLVNFLHMYFFDIKFVFFPCVQLWLWFACLLPFSCYIASVFLVTYIVSFHYRFNICYRHKLLPLLSCMLQVASLIIRYDYFLCK